MTVTKTISNGKEIGDDGLIYLKSCEVATLIEVKAIDLSLTKNAGMWKVDQLSNDDISKLHGLY